MVDIIDDINNNNMITDSSILVSFDIVNMFPSIDNVLGLEAVSEILSNRESDFPPIECILEALTICLECNNSVFDNVFYLPENGSIWISAQKPLAKIAEAEAKKTFASTFFLLT